MSSWDHIFFLLNWRQHSKSVLWPFPLPHLKSSERWMFQARGAVCCRKAVRVGCSQLWGRMHYSKRLLSHFMSGCTFTRKFPWDWLMQSDSQPGSANSFNSSAGVPVIPEELSLGEAVTPGSNGDDGHLLSTFWFSGKPFNTCYKIMSC